MYPRNPWEIVADRNEFAEYTYSVGTTELHHIIHCSHVSLGRIALLRFNYWFQNSLHLHNFFFC